MNCHDLTPVEAENTHHAHHQTPTPVGVSNYKISGHTGGIQLEATEADARANNWGVAPWYYEQIAILERFEAQ